MCETQLCKGPMGFEDLPVTSGDATADRVSGAASMGSMGVDTRIETFFDRLCQLFNEGRTDEIVDLYTSTLPVYSENGLTLYSQRTDTEVFVRRLTYAMRSAGTKRLGYRLIATIPSADGKTSMCHIEWLYIDANGKTINTGEVKYLCGPDRDETFKILMVDYIRSAFPEALAKLPLAETSRGRLN